jgi:hypothetical protein
METTFSNELTLGFLDEERVTFTSDSLTVNGWIYGVTFDRVWWERNGRPLKIAATVETTEGREGPLALRGVQ